MSREKKALDVENNCELCEKSRDIPGSDALVCQRYGLVRRSSICRRFVLDPLRLKPSLKKRPAGGYSSLDFTTKI